MALRKALYDRVENLKIQGGLDNPPSGPTREQIEE
jgi:hypothetical protein